MSLETLPDDLLLHLFTNYVSLSDLGRLELVCSRFHNLLRYFSNPWKRHLIRQTNLSFCRLKNSVGCPTIENVLHPRSIVSHDLHLPSIYSYQILFENSSIDLPIESNSSSLSFDRCENLHCDIHRLSENYRDLSILNVRWRRKNAFDQSKIIRFVHRAQTSLIQYDEHRHQLWFTCDGTLSSFNLNNQQIDHRYQFDNDDILSYKVYDDQFICIANGNQMRFVSQQTNEIFFCQSEDHRAIYPRQRNDILALDIFSNDRQNYLIVSGSRDHFLKVRTFDISNQNETFLWQTELDDRILATRLTPDARFLLVGTGGRVNEYPLILFDTSRARPLHIYSANYRLGAGVRCIEWIDSNVFIAAGFDSQFKEFDLRTGRCHYTFQDDFGNDYSSLCVSNDRQNISNAIILGGNHHSTVRLVNRKQRRTENILFVSDEKSPVHSLAVTAEYLIASVDRSIVALDFTGKNERFARLRARF